MGSVNIDNTGSGADVTLSSDGTDLLLDGTAIGGGGGGADLYAAETTGSTDPTASGTLSVAIGSSASASGTNAVAIGTGSEAGTYSVGIGWDSGNTGPNNVIIGRTSAATYNQGATVIGYNASSSGYSSNQTALGYNAKANTGAQATALTNSYASGTDSLAAAIANNTSSYGATGAGSIAIGDRAKATGPRAFATGYSSIASGNGARAFGGFGSGTGTLASKEGSTAIGDGARSDVSYKLAISTRSFTALGDAQTGITTLRAQTTNTTPIALYSDTNLPDTGNQVILPNKSAFAFHGTIVARQQASQGTASAAWKVEGLIRREGSAGTTVLVNSATTVLDNTPSWGLALSADTTNGGLKVEATGAASTNIRWVATIHTSEVIYA